MIGALYNGIAGLNSFQKALDVESNNISNVNTVGFKADSVSFADMMYQKNAGGKGSTISAVEKSFAQGSIKATGNPYDIAIDGKGFFVVQNDKNETVYSRAGDFRMGLDGTLQTANGFNVMGVVTNSYDINSTSANYTQFSSMFDKYLASQTIIENDEVKTYNARATNYLQTAVSDDPMQSGDGYKSASAKINDIEYIATIYRQRLSELNSELSQIINGKNNLDSVKVDGIDIDDMKSKLVDPTDTIEISINGEITTQPFVGDAQTTLNEFLEHINDSGRVKAYFDTQGLLKIDSLINGEKIDNVTIMINGQEEGISLIPINNEDPTNQRNTVSFSDYATKLTSSEDNIWIQIGAYTIRQSFDTDPQTTMKKFADQISSIKGLSASVDNSGKLTINSLVPGEEFKVFGAKINNSEYNIYEDSAQKGSGEVALKAVENALKDAIQNAGAEFLRIESILDLSKADTLAVDKVQLNLNNLNLSDNGFGTPEVVNGVIMMRQGDHSFVIGKLTTVYFNNLNGLNHLGDNLYAKTAKSGEPVYADKLNIINSGVLEMSNAELGDSLVNLMVFQRAFEANSKAITTSDEFLNIAIQLKK